MTDFKTKNHNRRTYFTNSGEHKSARLARRAYDGMFGNTDKEIYNHLVKGTSGAEK